MRLSVEEFARRFPEQAVAHGLIDKSALRKIKAIPKQSSASTKKSSVLESILAQQLHLAGFPVAEREYKFHPKRKWRMDFAWPDITLAVEVEGGIWNYGRHNRPQGFIDDTEKYNAAANLGWTVLRFAGEQIRSGEALTQIEEAFDLSIERMNSNLKCKCKPSK